MNITLNHIGRRFNREWIFRAIDFTFVSGGRYAVLGPNGSGKSTLLNVLMGSLSPSEGTLAYTNMSVIKPEEVFRHLSFAAPYIDLVEEFTLAETIRFHFNFKGYCEGLDAAEVLRVLGMEKAKDKALKHFSSGMKQRTKLALACCSDAPLLILDEPTSNLDVEGVDWYRQLIGSFGSNKTIIIGSNQEHEYTFCEAQLHISAYKK